MNSYILEFKNKNCLVTGGAGFIGSNLSRFLAKNGAKVTVIDNFSTGRRVNTLNFDDLGIKLIEDDISDQEKTSSYFSGIDFSSDSTSKILDTSIVTQYQNWNRDTEIKLSNILKRFIKDNNVSKK